MTRPAEEKVREGVTPGTRFDEFEVGAKMADVSFTITPAIIDEYILAVEGDEKLKECKFLCWMPRTTWLQESKTVAAR